MPYPAFYVQVATNIGTLFRMDLGGAAWVSLGDVHGMLSNLTVEHPLHLVAAAGVFFLAAFVRFPSSSATRFTLVPGAVLVALVRGMSVADATLALSIALACAGGLFSLGAVGHRGGFTWEIAMSPFLLPAAWWSWTPLIPAASGPTLATSSASGIVATAGVAVSWLAVDSLVRAASRRGAGAGIVDRLTTELRRSGPRLVMLSASASLAAMWDFSPAWALTISVGPFLVAQTLIASTLRAQAIEDLTIKALGRLPEAAGVAPSNHSTDVTELAVELGVLGGLTVEELSTLRRAALLHDVGLLAVRDAPYASFGYSEADKAQLGADILEESSALSSEALLLRQVGSVYRIPGSDPRADLDLRSHILRAACSFHRLVAAGSDSHDVVERMYLESYVHPQSVVEQIRPALARLK